MHSWIELLATLEKDLAWELEMQQPAAELSAREAQCGRAATSLKHQLDGA